MNRLRLFRRRPMGTPTVVFLDDSRWAIFHQLSPLLRRAGVRTVRVTTGQSSRSRLTSRLVYDRYVSLPTKGGEDVLRRIVTQENLIDIQFVETLVAMMIPVVDNLQDGVANQVRQRLMIMDKWKASARFREGGVLTPDVIALKDATPEQVIEQFGLPVVIKERTGCGGCSVTICDDAPTLDRTYQEHWLQRNDFYYERFVQGEKLNYGAVYSSDGVEQELGYRVTRWVPPVGTAIQVETIEDTVLITIGRRAVELSGCLGLMNIDVIQDAHGEYWLIDFNARAFGGATSFLLIGLDLSQGYLRSLHRRSAEPEKLTPDQGGIVVDIFPTCLDDAMRTGSYAAVLGAFSKYAAPFVRRLGVRFTIGEVLASMDATRRYRRQIHP